MHASKRDRPSGNSQTSSLRLSDSAVPPGGSICNNCFKGFITLIQRHLNNRQGDLDRKYKWPANLKRRSVLLIMKKGHK